MESNQKTRIFVMEKCVIQLKKFEYQIYYMNHISAIVAHTAKNQNIIKLLQGQNSYTSN